MRPEWTASVLIIGDEITTGVVADTNGGWMARQLTDLGFSVQGMEVVRDRIEEIVQALKRVDMSSHLVLVTGGLGPTTDDLTRDAFAKFLGVSLEEHDASLRKIEERYQIRGIPMNPISRRQALFPSGAEILNNSAGTADAFLVKANAYFFSLPGVPREMHVIYDEEILPRLKKEFSGLREPVTRFVRTFGLSESAVGTAVEAAQIGERFRVGYRPVFPETFVKIVSEGMSPEECDRALQRVCESIGPEFIVSHSEEESLPRRVLSLLKQANLSISFAESCSGGLLSDLLVSEPGSSAVFRGGVVCYSNELKEQFVGVSPELIQKHGAVSAEVAAALARGIRERTGSDLGVSVTGVAGPEGGTEEKPVGTVYFGYSREGREEVVRHFLPFDRNRIRKYSAYIGLDLARRELLKFPLMFQRR